MTQNICILGATGSVGAAALSVISEHPRRYRPHTLVAGRNWRAMATLCRRHRPAMAIMADNAAARELARELAGESICVEGGDDATLAAAGGADCPVVVAAIAGAGGVDSLLAAVSAGKRVLLANKEALIILGGLLPSAMALTGGELLPIDSEHCALFELLQASGRDYKTLWLTASGGSARDCPLESLPDVTLEMALAHPNWSMGKKITIDSATMMNKALEVMEASVLFQADAAKIGVVIHPQSLCHALVEYADNAMTANFSRPDMRLPIARMLAFPERLPAVVPPLSWQALSGATFFKPDAARYPCLQLAYAALRLGGAAPAALSAANDVAVQRFIAGDIRFTDIAAINAEVVNHLHGLSGAEVAVSTLAEIRAVEDTARARATQAAEKLSCLH